MIVAQIVACSFSVKRKQICKQKDNMRRFSELIFSWLISQIFVTCNFDWTYHTCSFVEFAEFWTDKWTEIKYNMTLNIDLSICLIPQKTERVDTGSMYVLYLPVIQADLCTHTTFRHMLYYSIVPASTLDWVYSSK